MVIMQVAPGCDPVIAPARPRPAVRRLTWVGFSRSQIKDYDEFKGLSQLTIVMDLRCENALATQ